MNYFIIFVVVVLAIILANVLMQMLILPRIMPKAPMMQKPPMNTVLDEISMLIDLEILSILEVPMSIRRIPLITDYTEVQNEIVKILKKKIGIIDSLISNETKQIEKLEEYKKAVITKAVTKGLDPDAKMKDSDVEWIGKIKQDYHCEKLKFLLSSPLLYGANESGGKQEKGCTRFIRITDIDSNGNLKDTNDNQYLSASKSTGYILKNKDILFARSGGTVGKSFLYKNPGFPCSFAGYLIKAECEETLLLPEFLYSYTKSSLYEIWKNMIFVQSTIQNIGAQRYGNLDIVIPSIAEQKQIVQYIDKKCMLIDKLIDTKNRTRKQLLNFKKSLIYEYVTGKKKVSL